MRFAPLCLALLLASVDSAQERPAAGAKGAILHRLTGGNVQEPLSGSSATVLYGRALARGASPVDSARALVERTRAALGLDGRSLELATGANGRSLVDVGRDAVSGGPRFHALRFHQMQDGIPVFRAGVGVLVRAEPGYPVVLSSFDVKDVSGIDTSLAHAPGAGQLTESMRQACDLMLDQQLFARGVPLPSRSPAIQTSEEELVVFTGSADAPVAPTLALKFLATRGDVRTDAPRFQRHLVVAALETGEILLSEDQIQQFTDVVGTVSGFATQGLNSLECDPEALVPLPYAEARVIGGSTTFADENGQFVIPHGGTTAITASSRLRGQYFEVFDDTTGGTTPELTASVTPPGPIDFVHNATPGNPFYTAGVNAYVEANRVRDFVLQYSPSYPTIATQTFFDLIVNQDSAFGYNSCQALYTGAELMFWRNAGGCNNSAFSDVVHHEYGHHLVAVAGNGQGQFGEGSGDCMGVLIQDDPILGQGFITCGVGIRTASNAMQYPCNGEIHDCGQLIAGCVWSLRNELVVTEPADYLDIGASLFIDMLIVRGMMTPGDSTIGPLITIIYLTLDDDDATIGNGTPHYSEIARAFGDHGMDAPPLELIAFSYPGGRPNLLAPGGGVPEFTFEVTSLTDSPVPGTGMLYLDRGAGLETFALPELSPNVYEVSFPPLTCGSTVRYHVGAESASGPVVLDPPGAPTAPFVAIATTSYAETFLDTFQTNLGWTVSGSVADGPWQRAIPAGGGDRGDPPTDADGSGFCYVTDNADGNSDVDGGSTTLTSPLLDARTGAQGEALLSYSRWYSNNTGDATDDIFRVEISGDGGSSWVPLETVGVTDPEASGGWYEKVFPIADFVEPTASVRVRFIASDLGAGSIVEAGVDHVRVLRASCPSAKFQPAGAPSAPPRQVQGQ